VGRITFGHLFKRDNSGIKRPKSIYGSLAATRIKPYSKIIVDGFIWKRKNVEHIAEHGITPEEAEYIIVHAKSPYPEIMADGKWLVRGRTRAGRYIQTIFVMESDAADLDYSEIDLVMLDPSEDGICVIHARPLTEAEKSAFKRKRKSK